MKNLSKQDSKLFRTKIGGWQERYMDRLNNEYIKILSNPDKQPSEKFWEVADRIKEDRRHPGVIYNSRDDYELIVVRLLVDKIISGGDIGDFSDEFKERIKFILERYNVEI